MTATDLPFASRNARARRSGIVVSGAASSRRTHGWVLRTSARSGSPQRSATSTSSSTSLRCLERAVRQSIKSPRPLTDGTTTVSDGSVILCRLRRRAIRGPAQISDAFSNGPGSEEEYRCRKREEERAPSSAGGRPRDSPRQERGQEWTGREEEPAPRARFLDEPLARKVAPMLIAVGTERGDAV